MKRQLPFYVLAAAVLIVGAVAFGVPASSLWILGVVALCPLMMIVMMGACTAGMATAAMATAVRGAATSPRIAIATRG